MNQIQDKRSKLKPFKPLYELAKTLLFWIVVFRFIFPALEAVNMLIEQGPRYTYIYYNHGDTQAELDSAKNEWKWIKF